MHNWKALQAYGCRKPDFSPPSEVNVRHMEGGCRHANLSKDGVRHVKTRGARKATGKAKLTYGNFWKEKIFNPVKLRVNPSEGVYNDKGLRLDT